MKPQKYLNQNHSLKEYSLEEKETATELNLNRQNLEGHLDLREFVNLEILEANYNQLTSIDLSKCFKLKKVSVLGNKLTSLYLSWQPFLNSLVCSENQLNFLDLSGNQELKTLFANDNKLTNLNFLDQLECPEKLKRLSLNNNKLSPLSLNYFLFFPNLKTLLIANNPFYGKEEDIESLKRLRWSNFEKTNVEVKLESKIAYIAKK